MRMPPGYVEIIKRTAHEILGEAALVRLFGSRTDDAKRGGDFDLHVEADRPVEMSSFSAENRMRVRLGTLLDDEPIDLIVRYRDEPMRWIDRVAVETGIIL